MHKEYIGACMNAFACTYHICIQGTHDSALACLHACMLCSSYIENQCRHAPRLYQYTLGIAACMHSFSHTCMHAHVQPYMHTCTRSAIHAYMHANKQLTHALSKYIDTYTHTRIHVRESLPSCNTRCIHACIHTQMYVHTCMHTHIDARLNLCARAASKHGAGQRTCKRSE